MQVTEFVCLLVITLNLLSLIYLFIKIYVLFLIRPKKKQCRVGRTEETPSGRAKSGHRCHRLHRCHTHQRMPPRRPLELREIALQLARSLRRFSFQPLRENPLLDIFFIVRILCFNNKSVNLFLPKSEGFDLSDHLLPYKSGSGLLYVSKLSFVHHFHQSWF